MSPTYPPERPKSEIGNHWSATVASLAQVVEPSYPPDELERRAIYCHLVCSLVADFWNPHKPKSGGKLPSGTAPTAATGYLGHNIACIAVDSLGHIIDFDFNHNEVFNSSIEHAEARLLRRLFALADFLQGPVTFALPRLKDGLVLNAFADLIEGVEGAVANTRSHYSRALSEVTLYTSLESCAQCSGLMALGAVREVVFLQPDPGQNCIGNVLYNLNGKGSAFSAPAPIPASACGVPEYQQLQDGFAGFEADTKRSITSYLCTDEALGIFKQGQATLRSSVPAHPSAKPTGVTGALTNQEVWLHALKFARTAVARGRRGTPH